MLVELPVADGPGVDRVELDALARRLDAEERHAAGLRRLLVAAHPAPAWVLNRRRDLVAWNPPAEALLGPLTPGTNHLHLVFGDRAVLWADPALVAQDAVASLRAATAEVREHPTVTVLVGELAAAHPAFARLWVQRDVQAACWPPTSTGRAARPSTSATPVRRGEGSFAAHDQRRGVVVGASSAASSSPRAVIPSFGKVR